MRDSDETTETTQPRTRTLAIIAGVGAIVGSLVIGHGDCGQPSSRLRRDASTSDAAPIDAAVPLDGVDTFPIADSN
jgi:hypothetical protein